MIQAAIRNSFGEALCIALLLTGSAWLRPPVSVAYCGDANSDQDVTTTDALGILRSAVGIGSLCDRNCECDVDFNREITAVDALATLKAAVRDDLYPGCGNIDECFYDEDCDAGSVCGEDPDWSCDAACVPASTSTTEVVIEDCFSDDDCEGDSNGEHCCVYECAECDKDQDCPEGFACGACACVPLP